MGRSGLSMAAAPRAFLPLSPVQSLCSSLGASHDENRQLRMLIAALHVKKEDFVLLHSAGSARASAMEGVGRRLLTTLLQPDRSTDAIRAFRPDPPPAGGDGEAPDSISPDRVTTPDADGKAQPPISRDVGAAARSV